MRKTIVVLFVLCAKIAQAQIYIDSYRFAQAGPANLLLDDYPGATAAYSLRKLDKDYTGSAIRIRTAGGSETDIGFDSNGDLNTAAITTFCAGTTCTVATWYDQSGNGRHANQNTVSLQPLIYSSGAIRIKGTKPAIYFSGSTALLSTVTKTTSNTAIAVLHHYTSGTSIYNFPFSFFSDRVYTFQSSNQISVASNTGAYFFTSYNPYIYQVVSIFYKSSSVFYSNGVQRGNGSLTVTAGFGNIIIGDVDASGNTIQTNNDIQEIIYYTTDVGNTNRAAIENNINTYYSIY